MESITSPLANTNQQRGIVEILEAIDRCGYRNSGTDNQKSNPEVALPTSGSDQHGVGIASELGASEPRASDDCPMSLMNEPRFIHDSDIELRQVLSEEEVDLYRAVQPTPLPAVYDVEPDFFDLNRLEARLDWIARKAEQLAAVVTIPAPQLDSNEESSLLPPSTENANHNLFLVSTNGQVIDIDGRDGFDYIDLACFDISQASFEGDGIYLKLPGGGTFQVRYQNIKYALFANDQQVELGTDDKIESHNAPPNHP